MGLINIDVATGSIVSESKQTPKSSSTAHIARLRIMDVLRKWNANGLHHQSIAKAEEYMEKHPRKLPGLMKKAGNSPTEAAQLLLKEATGQIFDKPNKKRSAAQIKQAQAPKRRVVHKTVKSPNSTPGKIKSKSAVGAPQKKSNRVARRLNVGK